MISELCYELYKVDWKQFHIGVEREKQSIKDYYKFLIEEDLDDILYTYDDYIEEFGYNGEMYVCYEEFLEMEYLDEYYIRSLLNNVQLIEMYYKDINK